MLKYRVVNVAKDASHVCMKAMLKNMVRHGEFHKIPAQLVHVGKGQLIVRTIGVQQHNAIIQVHRRGRAVRHVMDAFIEEEITEMQIEFHQVTHARHAYAKVETLIVEENLAQL